MITLSTNVVDDRFFLCSTSQSGQSKGGTEDSPVGPVTHKAITRGIVDEEYVDHANTFYAVQARPAHVPVLFDRRPCRTSAP